MKFHLIYDINLQNEYGYLKLGSGIFALPNEKFILQKGLKKRMHAHTAKWHAIHQIPIVKHKFFATLGDIAEQKYY